MPGLWTGEEDDLLRELAAAGYSASRMAIAISTKYGNDRSRNAVIGRAGRIGALLNPRAARVMHRQPPALSLVSQQEDTADEMELSLGPTEAAFLRKFAREWPYATAIELAEATGYNPGFVLKAVSGRRLGSASDFEDKETRAYVAAMRASLLRKAA